MESLSTSEATKTTKAIYDESSLETCGDNLEKYFEMTILLGQGAYGKVYKANVLPSAKAELPQFMPEGIAETVEKVAIKQIHMTGESRRLILQELDILRFAGGQYFMQYYGCFIKHDQLYVVMELCNGQDLKSIGLDLPIERKNIVLYQVAQAIRDLHSLDIVHRDIKPANIMICDGNTKLVDYGMSAILSNVSHQYNFAGTPNYLDLWARDRRDGKRADWWSWGQLAVWLYTGRNNLTEMSSTVPHVKAISVKGKKYRFRSVSKKSLTDSGALESIADLLIVLTDPMLHPVLRPAGDKIISTLESVVNS